MHSQRFIASRSVCRRLTQLSLAIAIAIACTTSLATALPQSTPYWWLDVLDQCDLPQDGQYNPPGDGAGVDIYVLSSGINATHGEFGTPPILGFDAIGGPGAGADCQGTGTYLASLAGGSTFGVAKQANLIDVRVLNCLGSGSLSDILAGMDWVWSNHAYPRPGVALIGFQICDGSPGLPASLLHAFQQLIDVGIVPVVGADVTADCSCLAALPKEVIVMGALNSSGCPAPFVGCPSEVDLWAGGVSVTGAGNNSPTDTVTMSSFLAPAALAAGVAANFMGLTGVVLPRDVKCSMMAASCAGGCTDPNQRRLHDTATGIPQSSPPKWLDALDEAGPSLDGVYSPPGCGAGVDIYVLSTGIDYRHTEFGDRVNWGHPAGGGAMFDACGQGTYLASLAGGSTYGPAKAANLISVKVDSCLGDPLFVTPETGMDWIAADHVQGTPAVALIPFTICNDPVLLAKIQALIDDDIVVVMGASDTAGCGCFAALPKEVIVMGALDPLSFCPAPLILCPSEVDLWAGGWGVQGAGLNGPTSTVTLSDYAGPAALAAGVAANFMGLTGVVEPADVKCAMLAASSAGWCDPTELRLRDTTVPATCILSLGGASVAPCGTTCNSLSLQTIGGNPSIGNANFAFETAGAPEGYAYLWMGVAPATPGIPLFGGTFYAALDPGSQWHPFSGQALFGAPMCTEKATYPTPIPNNTNLIGRTFSIQGVIICPSLSDVALTNAVELTID